MNQACLHQVITLDQSFSSDKTVKHSVSGDSIVTDFFILVVIKLGSQVTWVAFLFLWFWPYKVWARSSWSLFALHFLDWVFRCGKLLFYFLELLESPFVIFFVLDVGVFSSNMSWSWLTDVCKFWFCEYAPCLGRLNYYVAINLNAPEHQPSVVQDWSIVEFAREKIFGARIKSLLGIRTSVR